jgi:hypothetical protein
MCPSGEGDLAGPGTPRSSDARFYQSIYPRRKGKRVLATSFWGRHRTGSGGEPLGSALGDPPQRPSGGEGEVRYELGKTHARPLGWRGGKSLRLETINTSPTPWGMLDNGMPPAPAFRCSAQTSRVSQHFVAISYRNDSGSDPRRPPRACRVALLTSASGRTKQHEALQRLPLDHSRCG